MPDVSQFVPPPVRIEATPRRIRVCAGDVLVAESDRAMLLAWYGPGRLPTYCVPPDDVRTELMTAAAESSIEMLVDHDVHVGDNTIAHAARLFRDPPGPLAELDGYWTFTWDAGLSWYEEAMEVHVHARDTNKRVDVVPSHRHVQVGIDGTIVADSTQTHALFETSLPTRWYFPPTDVRLDLFTDSDTVTRCPYKGTAAYLTARIGDAVHHDVAWIYGDPVPNCSPIRGLVAFFNERVDLVIDGVEQQRPRTPWSV